MITGLLEYFLPVLVLVLPASLLMGGGLPVLDRIAIHSADVSGPHVGDIHLSNILSSVAGSLGISFIFLPLLGSELTLKLLGILSLAFAAMAWKTENASRPAGQLGLPLALISLLLILPWRGEFYRQVYRIAAGVDELVHESGDSVLALSVVGKEQSPIKLWIGGVQNSYFPTDGRYERSALPCVGASHPKRILVIGLGGANTTYFLTHLPGVEQILIVELMEDLGPFLNEHISAAQKTFADPRVQYVADDGRRYLYANPDERFDLIFIDPLYSYTAGHNNLYSREAMQLYQTHLTDGGVFCGVGYEEYVLPKTADVVFPQVDHFRELIVAGSQPLVYDRADMDQAFDRFLSNNRIAREAKTPFLTDMNAWLEYYYFHAPFGE